MSSCPVSQISGCNAPLAPAESNSAVAADTDSCRACGAWTQGSVDGTTVSIGNPRGGRRRLPDSGKRGQESCRRHGRPARATGTINLHGVGYLEPLPEVVQRALEGGRPGLGLDLHPGGTVAHDVADVDLCPRGSKAIVDVCPIMSHDETGLGARGGLRRWPERPGTFPAWAVTNGAEVEDDRGRRGYRCVSVVPQ